MALRNVPKSYTFDQQREEINTLAGDVGDITQLASGLPSVVAAINQIQAGSADGGELLNGPAAPTSGDGANGDFWLDTSTNDLYGPKESGAWPATTISFSEQILSGVVAPLTTLGKVNDYYFDSAKKELYGPKTASGWGLPTPRGEADYDNVLYVKPSGDDNNTGKSPSKAFQSIKAAAKAATATDGNTTIRVATGKYYEDNPVYLPNGTSIVGDNLRETIVTEMIQDDGAYVADTMAQMMAVGDTAMGAYMMNEIVNAQPIDGDQRNLAMDVLATFTEVASDKMDAYMQSDPDMMSNFTQSAFENAGEGDAEMIADMMQQTSGKNSAYLMSSMMENNNTMISSVYGNLADQEFDIFNHIEKAKMTSTNPGNDTFSTPSSIIFQILFSRSK